MHRLLTLAALASSMSCSYTDAGLIHVSTGNPDGWFEDATVGPDAAPDAGIDAAAAERRPPAQAGCADGTREGFVDEATWPTIAACAGGWAVPGLAGDDAIVPRCDRSAGNDGTNSSGEGCRAADLCAVGWHICRSLEEVARSGTQCEGALLTHAPAFFAAAIGASPAGLCVGGPDAMNDLHGCGNFGAYENPTCSPLGRALTFADCAATGVWHCGESSDWSRELMMATKDGPALGGVLCCADPASPRPDGGGP